FFSHDKQNIRNYIEDVCIPAKETAARLNLDLTDLFDERADFLSKYCAEENVYIVLWTHPNSLSGEQLKIAMKDKGKYLRENKTPLFLSSQNLLAAIPDLRDSHDAFVRSVLTD